MSRIDESSIHSGEIEVLEGFGTRGTVKPSYGGDDERTTFLPRRTPTLTFDARPRRTTGEERTVVDMAIPAPRPRFAPTQDDERTVVQTQAAPRPRPSSRPTPLPPWQQAKPATTTMRPPAPSDDMVERIAQIREATFVAPIPQAVKQLRETTSYAAPKSAPSPRAVEVPAPAPRATMPSEPPRVDTLAPTAVAASDSTAALMRDLEPSRPSIPEMITRAPKPAFLMAASAAAVAAIFAMGITVGVVAFSGSHADAQVAAASASMAKGAPLTPIKTITSSAPVAPSETTAIVTTPAPAANTTAAATPTPTPNAAPALPPPPAPVAAAPAKHEPEHRAERPHVWHPAPAPAAVAAAPKPATPAAPKRVAKAAAGNELDDANAADALAKAQLEASLR